MSDIQELQKQFDWYLANQEELVSRFDGRWIVITGESVIGVFASQSEAYSYAVANLQPGTFLIQLVGPGDENYSRTFHSRVGN